MNLNEKISEIFPLLKLMLNQNDLRDFKNTDTKDLCLWHFGLGLWIRNNILIESNSLYQIFIENNIADKDDMSAKIINLFHSYLNL